MSNASEKRRIVTMSKQTAFVQCNASEVLYSGAYGCGKTVALAIKLWTRARVPGARELLVRKFLADVRDTTVKQLLEGDGGFPPVLTPGSYTHNKNEHTITLHGGGQIRYMGINNDAGAALRIASINASGLAVEQAEELNQGQYEALLGRIRSTVPGLRPQIYMVCNPDAPTHWLAERFSIFDKSKRHPDRKVVFTRTTDNVYLPREYMQQVATFTAWRRMRYVDGLWVGASGVIYDNFRHRDHVRGAQGPWDKIVLAVDDGTTNPCAMLLMASDGRRVHVLAENYERELTSGQKVEAAKRLTGQVRQPVAAVVVDPAAAGIKADMRAVPLPVEDGDNEVLAGIEVVRQMFGDGLLTIDPGCVNLIKELSSYRWAENKPKDTPIKENDHACDALRYGIMRLRRPADAAVSEHTLSVQPAGQECEYRGLAGAGSTPEIEDANLSARRVDAITWPVGREWRIWGSPSRYETYVIGAAIATTSGESCLVVLSPGTGRKVAEMRAHVTPAEAARQIAAAGVWWGQGQEFLPVAALRWDGAGAFCIGHLNVLQYPLWRAPDMKRGSGWKFSADAQTRYIIGLREAMDRQQYREPSERTMDELSQYVQTSSGLLAPKSAGGAGDVALHADGVVATMLAWQVCLTQPAKEAPETEFWDGWKG
jgi:PBSX family phage terminase large subunit